MSSKNFAVKHGLTVGDNEIITSAGDVNVIGTIKINGTTGTSGQILQTTGTGLAWIQAPSGGGSSTIISDTAPASANPGDMWLDSISGLLYVFTELGGDGQWIQPKVGYAGSSQVTVMDYGLVTEEITSSQDYGIIV